MTLLTAFAPAKVNLFLHVGAAKPNGRHDLDSLVVFSDGQAGDHVGVELGDDVSLEVSGPYSEAAGVPDDNLVLRAARRLKAASGTGKGARIMLRKDLPVAAGIGGGSSDAAATLRLLTLLWEIDPAHAATLAPGLGGDVPAALAGVPVLMRGEGERVERVQLPGRLPALLVNPGVPCPTGAVFQAYDEAGGGRLFSELERFPSFVHLDDLIDWLGQQRNDLEAAAIARVPEVSAVLSFLKAQPGARLVRMSGSGATCFAIFDALSFAERAARLLKQQTPGWWAAPCRLGAVP
jgi:4-diphosphocytidyl-2-C-methyl-D-erythritol kinase